MLLHLRAQQLDLGDEHRRGFCADFCQARLELRPADLTRRGSGRLAGAADCLAARASQQLDLGPAGGQRRIELGQRRLELGVVMTDRLYLGMTASVSAWAASMRVCAVSRS